MKRSFFAILLIAIVSIFSFVSCEEPETVVPPKEYSTPTIKGKVSIPSGKNVKAEDIFVKVIDEDGKTITVQKANADATFVVEGLSLSSRYSILFTSVEPEFGNRSLTRGTDSNGVGGWLNDIVPALKEGKDVGSVKMKPLGTIKGKALIEGKTEHYDITVYIPGTSYIARTDSDGSYSIYNVPEGTYKLRYTLDDHIPVMVEDVNLVCPENEENPELKVKDVLMKSSFGSVEGIATINGEVDHTGIIVKLESSDRSVSYTSTTSADGIFRFSEVLPGRYNAVASREGYLSVSSGDIIVEAASLATIRVDLTLFRNAGTVMGNVKLSGETKGTSGITVSFTSPTDTFTTTTDANGDFVKLLKTETYSVRASYSGYSPQTTEVEVLSNTTVTVNLPSLVRADGAVSGFVILNGSGDFSGVVITLVSANDESKTYNAVSSSDGSFRITGIKNDGTYLMTYSKDGFVSDKTKSIAVSLGSVANAGTVTLKTLKSTVSGRIQLEDALTHEGVMFLVKNDSMSYPAAVTDQDGNFTVSGVLPGTYTLLASKDGFVSATSREFVVEPSSEKTLDPMSIKVAIRSMLGKITLENMSDHAGALITATNLSDSTKVYSAISNSAGDFTLAGMIPGEYRVVISASGYRTRTLPTVNVVSYSVADLGTTNIEINRGTISGTATLEGRMNHTGITVELMRGMDVYETTTTDSTGSYSFYVPQGNYSGVRYSMTDFETGSVSRSIALFADNYVSMGDSVLTATHNTVYGRVDVLTTDDESTVSVSFDGIDTIAPIVTEEDGSFSFEHVPLGTYVMRFRRTDCSDITVPVEVIAADGINLNTITLTPNTATVKGKVTLRDALSNNGVTVSIDMGGGKILSTTTDNSGRYEIGGVSVADTYTVTYTKDGWDSASQTLSTRLNVLEVRELDEVEMVDTTAPVLRSVTINNGSNTASDTAVILHIEAEDGGSGLKTMAISDTNTSDVYDYSGTVSWTLESSNGLKTVRVKVIDRAGNESEIVSASVTLTDQKTTVSSVLRGDKLTWTKENSPYLVTGNIMVDSSDTLTIEPGVDVQFNGDFYIQVEGKLIASGTESDRINFYGVGNGKDNWDGMRFINAKGSILSYVDIDGIKNGIIGYCDIDHAFISANSRAIGKGKYSGEVLIGNVSDSIINGNVFVNGNILRNEIVASNVYLSGMVADNIISGSIEVNSANVDGNVFSGNSFKSSYSLLFNNIVSTEHVTSISDVQRYITYNNCSISIGEKTSSDDMIMSSVFSEVEFYNCSFAKYIAEISESNFINCGTITITTKRNTEQKTFDATSNYWGDLNTVELRANGHDSDLSFIHDYMNDFNLSKVDASGWKDAPISNIGYRGEGYGREVLDSNTYEIGGRGPAGGYVFYDKGFYSDGWRYLEAAPSDIGRYQFGFYFIDENYIGVGTRSLIGAGKTNTERLVYLMDIDGKAYSTTYKNETANYAAKKCLDYEYGGYDDWFLPSTTELNKMYMALKCEGGENHGEYCSDKTHDATSTAETRASFANSLYWSSKEYGSYNVYARDFNDGRLRYGDSHGYRGLYNCVRPVRAF